MPGRFIDHRVVTGEVSAILDYLAHLVVQRLDRVGGDLAFDEPTRGGALVEGFASLLFTFSGAFVFDGANGQP